MRYTLLAYLFFLLSSCNGQEQPVQPGAAQLEKLLSETEGKNIAIVANQSTLLNGNHLVDTLYRLSRDRFSVRKIFAPEHGFRGDVDDGVAVSDDIDKETGIPVISLYGRNKKPNKDQLQGIDMVIFDIQDVGVRFYTFISTLHYVMEACAEERIPVVILDRPNPNGNYVDGPLLEPEFHSFVGMHPIPVVHGLTIGELAMMINGERWLEGGIRCELKVIPCLNYSRHRVYKLPVKPSPNLPNEHTIKIYPSTCFFEGTIISEGRGTQWPFEVYGHPELPGEFSFTPVGIPGMSMYPKLKGETCYGEDLRSYVPEGGWNRLELKWVIDAYNNFPRKEDFFTPYFDKLAGTARLRKQIEEGWTMEEIRESWQADLDAYKAMRTKYLIYE
ncbi:MAG: DUF1343 domain-containing protein [Bacteroidales bacterium]